MTDTTLILEIGFAFVLLGSIVGYVIVNLLKPKHFFWARTPIGIWESYRIKRPTGLFMWTDKSDKTGNTKVPFTLDHRFAMPTRSGAKSGYRFMGDTTTGALVMYNGNQSGWAYMDPKFSANAHLDKRVRDIVQSTKADKWDKLEKYIMPALIIVGMIACAILYFVYKMYNAQHGGG